MKCKISKPTDLYKKIKFVIQTIKSKNHAVVYSVVYLDDLGALKDGCISDSMLRSLEIKYSKLKQRLILANVIASENKIIKILNELEEYRVNG